MDYVSYLEKLNAFGIKPGLSRISRLCELLQNPERKFRAVHISGTNGKGSTAAMTAAVLAALGLTTGLYTSPHLISYTERIKLNGHDIGEDDFASFLQIVRDAAEAMVRDGDQPPTQFEVLTATAFLYFAEKGAEYAVIEAGLGGLLDSTNVILPKVSVITNVTAEHLDRCGGTLAGVAHHKAGIIKPKIPAVTAARGMPLRIIKAAATEKEAPLYVAGEDFSFAVKGRTPKGQTVSLSVPDFGIDDFRYFIPFIGEHQAENSAAALMSIALLAKDDSRLSMEAARSAIWGTKWPGRFERMDVDGKTVVIDGAHNPSGMEALRRTLDEYFPDSPRVFILGILRDKDIDAMLRTLLRPCDMVVTTTPDSERAVDAASLARRISGSYVTSVPEPELALKKALELASCEHLVCCAGSLYLIGKIRKLLLTEKEH